VIATYKLDQDPLITDQSVCNNDGGKLGGDGCELWYPVYYIVNFKPTGALSTKASCDPPGTYTVQPKGDAVTVAVPFNPDWPLTTGSTPETCVVQVWLYQ
jgi:hypothetical protein